MTDSTFLHPDDARRIISRLRALSEGDTLGFVKPDEDDPRRIPVLSIKGDDTSVTVSFPHDEFPGTAEADEYVYVTLTDPDDPMGKPTARLESHDGHDPRTLTLITDVQDGGEYDDLQLITDPI